MTKQTTRWSAVASSTDLRASAVMMRSASFDSHIPPPSSHKCATSLSCMQHITTKHAQRNLHIHMHTHACTHMHAHTCMHTHARMHMHARTCTHACACTHMRTCTCTCTHTHTHKHYTEKIFINPSAKTNFISLLIHWAILQYQHPFLCNNTQQINLHHQFVYYFMFKTVYSRDDNDLCSYILYGQLCNTSSGCWFADNILETFTEYKLI